MILKDIPLALIDVSEFNSRRSLATPQAESALEDLARSIDSQGLLHPITVIQKSDGRYAVLAGQRRLLACRRLGWASLPAIARYCVDDEDALALSLVENVHRADMNPQDKARAFHILLKRLGDVASVSRETGVSAGTIRKYLVLNELAPELQVRLAEGDAEHLEALARLSKRFEEKRKQVAIWEKIDGLTQNAQVAVIREVASDLTNLETLARHATDGAATACVRKRDCPFDCAAIPGPLKEKVAQMIRDYKSEAVGSRQ